MFNSLRREKKFLDIYSWRCQKSLFIWSSSGWFSVVTGWIKLKCIYRLIKILNKNFSALGFVTNKPSSGYSIRSFQILAVASNKSSKVRGTKKKWFYGDPENFFQLDLTETLLWARVVSSSLSESPTIVIRSSRSSFEGLSPLVGSYRSFTVADNSLA